MKSYKGVIFDLDGTVLDTIQDLAGSVNQVLSDFGYPIHSYDAYKTKIGHGFRNLMEVSLPFENRTEEIIEEMLSRFLKVYDAKYMEETRPYAGIDELLDMLQKKRIKIAVNSNKRDDYTKNLIKKNFPNISFVDVIGERSGIAKKPDPTSALEIAEKMKLPVSEILYIGDSGTDMITGKNAGMDTVGVLWGFRDCRELEKNKAVYIVKSPEEILQLF